MSVSYPSDSRPHIQMRHIDGPVLWMRDGRLHWLTIWERIAVRFGWHDAYSLECKHWGRRQMKQEVKLCRDCLHQMPTPGSEWNSQCLHPRVNAKNAWALANTGGGGLSASSSAKDERDRGWLSPCGMRGALWEPKQGDSK